MPKLTTWVRKIRRSRETKCGSRSSLSSLPVGLPILPKKRQRVLTPSPSDETLIQVASDATAKSPFFQWVPLELRRMIYIAAFGKRTVHMDLKFDHPELPGPAHARLNPDRMNPRDRTAAAEWRWWSSVCHRHPMVEGWMDQCRTGMSFTACFLYPGEIPDKCFLGVMGWLLTCRQA